MTNKDEALRIALEALESSKQLVEISLNQAIARDLSDATVHERTSALSKHEAAIIAIKQAQAEVMVNMTPPATARDKWMYEQGRLAERDPRTHAIEQAQQAQEKNKA